VFNAYVFLKVTYVFRLILYNDDIILIEAFIYVLYKDSITSTYYVSSNGKMINTYLKVLWKESNVV
jgi:hypothetical protein